MFLVEDSSRRWQTRRRSGLVQPDLCDVHGRETEDIFYRGFGDICSNLREAAHICNSMGSRVEKC